MAMDGRNTVTQELLMAEEAERAGHDGKARVCARRAVALAVHEWQALRQMPRRHGDALSLLRHVQHEPSIPLEVRQAAERLSTPITRREVAPFAKDPIGDAKVIIAYLNQKHSVL